jgi:hypothetical protein
MSTERNQHLDAVLKTHSIGLDVKIKAYQAQRDRIKEALQAEFGSRMYDPINSGSYADINLLLQNWIAYANHRLEIGKAWATTVLERKDGDFGIRVFKREDVKGMIEYRETRLSNIS